MLPDEVSVLTTRANASPVRPQAVVTCRTASSQPADPEVNYSLLLLVCLKSHI